MNPSGPGTFCLGILFITDLISLTDIGLFRWSIFLKFYQTDLAHFIRVIKFIDIVVAHNIT